MQIRSIRANNFKSLVEFQLCPPKFTCLIGLNGVGKSTVLQFIDFLAQQVRGNLKGWFEERHWEPKDVNSRLTPRKNIDFSVELVSSNGDKGVSWKASFNTHSLHCTSESIKTPGAELEVQNGHLRIVDLRVPDHKEQEVVNEKIAFSYQGSVLSQLRPESLPKSLLGFSNYFKSVKSLDLLSPEYLRQRTRESAGSIGLGGQRLSAFLHEIGTNGRKDLAEQLKQVYPQLQSVDTESLRSGWKQLKIQETYGQRRLTTEARHINDGMLRLLAILAELQAKDFRFLMFDEIENGINPELVEFVLDALISADQQILVTTHSPLVLNYIEDEIAKDGVIYLYKTEAGSTQAIPFFSIPSLEKKLKVMGPGEAYADTNLTELHNEISLLNPEGK